MQPRSSAWHADLVAVSQGASVLGWIVPACEAACVTKLVNSWVEIRGTGLRSSSLHGLYWLIREARI